MFSHFSGWSVLLVNVIFFDLETGRWTLFRTRNEVDDNDGRDGEGCGGVDRVGGERGDGDCAYVRSQCRHHRRGEETTTTISIIPTRPAQLITPSTISPPSLPPCHTTATYHCHAKSPPALSPLSSPRAHHHRPSPASTTTTYHHRLSQCLAGLMEPFFTVPRAQAVPNEAQNWMLVNVFWKVPWARSTVHVFPFMMDKKIITVDK